MLFARLRLCRTSLISLMPKAALANSSAAIWQRIIQPGRKTMDAAAAHAVLNLRFSKRDLDRADALAAKARAGSLTAEEEQEIERFRTIGSALEFLKSKARRSLAA